MVNPEYEIEDADEVRCHSGRIVPVYPLTTGLGQRFPLTVLTSSTPSPINS
jgi:hypothetical protein